MDVKVDKRKRFGNIAWFLYQKKLTEQSPNGWVCNSSANARR